MNDYFTDDDISEASQHPSLGPEYFAARRFMENFAKGWTEEHLKPFADQITKEISDSIRDRVWSDFADYLIQDTEYNAMGAIRQMVNDTVQALLSGKKWALERFPLTGGYDPQEIRNAVAGHIGDQIAKARIADLEKEVADLKERIRYFR